MGEINPAIAILSSEEASRTVLNRQPSANSTYPAALLESLVNRFGPGATPEKAVRQIIGSIKNEGEVAARRWSAEFDGLEPDPMMISASSLEQAWDETHEQLRRDLQQAADRIRQFHNLQPVDSWFSGDLGGRLGQRIGPIARVGIYVPGGSAPLPSSLLMSVIPAQVAGVSEIIVATPPNPDKSILAAAHLCGLDSVLQLGGAQAIGALAYGLDCCPPVDKVVGAGGLFVTLAKKEVFGDVGIDGLAGPTETMILADESADPNWVAADLLAQAEHDPLASAILLTNNRKLADAVQRAVEEQLPNLSREQIIRQSLASNGAIVLVKDLPEAIELADEYAAEHLCLLLKDAPHWADRIANAGGLFIGEYSFEVLGDYVAGPSHVMPTGGSARFASPLSVLDFIKITTWVELDASQGATLAGPAARIAETEQLTAHAAAARKRMEVADD